MSGKVRRPGRGGQRVKMMKDEAERLTFAMQKFCLSPTKKQFDEICACSALSRDIDSFTIWHEACLYKYSGQSDWDEVDPHRPGTSHQAGGLADGGDFITSEEALCEKAVLTPSKTVAIQVMHMFYATGELKYIDLFYQCMGHERLPMQTKQYLAQLYAATKKMYVDEVLMLLAKDPAHFVTGAGRGMRLDVAGFTYFDNVSSIAAHALEMQNVSSPLAQASPTNQLGWPVSFPQAAGGAERTCKKI